MNKTDNKMDNEANNENNMTDEAQREHEEERPKKRGDKKQASKAKIESDILLTPAQFDEIKTNIETLQKERDEYLQTAQRLQAEFDNFRRRTAAIRVESSDDGMRELAKELLPVMDNLERAVESGGSSGNDAFLQGVVMVQKQFLDTLTKMGMSHIEDTGKFDPELHNAVIEEELEGKAPGDIAEVLQKGYMFKNKVIRYTMVKVAK